MVNVVYFFQKFENRLQDLPEIFKAISLESSEKTIISVARDYLHAIDYFQRSVLKLFQSQELESKNFQLIQALCKTNPHLYIKNILKNFSIVSKKAQNKFFNTFSKSLQKNPAIFSSHAQDIASLSDTQKSFLFIDRERWFPLRQKLLDNKEEITHSIESLSSEEEEDYLWIKQCLEKNTFYLEECSQEEYVQVIDNSLSQLFDREEPGYYLSMLKAFDFIIDTLGIKADVNFLESLHKKCLKYTNFSSKQIHPGHFGRQGNYALPYLNEEAIEEMRKEDLIDKLSNIVANEVPEDRFVRFIANHCNYALDNVSIEEIKNRIDSAFLTYYDEIEKASDDRNSLLSAIVKLCRFLEVLHPFEDGNQRTIAFCLLNKLLIENGFSACLLASPFIFDGGHTIAQMIDEVEEGILFFKNFLENQRLTSQD